MNNDLISRSALHSAISLDTKRGTYGEFMDGSEVSFTSNEVHSMLDEATAVDAVDADKALEWLEEYTFTDTKQVYTNGTVLVPLFRVRQALKDKAYNGLMEG